MGEKDGTEFVRMAASLSNYDGYIATVGLVLYIFEYQQGACFGMIACDMTQLAVVLSVVHLQRVKFSSLTSYLDKCTVHELL